MPYAHSRNLSGERHDLVAHLRGVAALAESFATKFGAAEPARFLGLWHDIGKFHPAFQDYLLAAEASPGTHSRSPDHKSAGAMLARQYLGRAALLIQGHRGGLRTLTDLKTWLAEPGKDLEANEVLGRARRALSHLEPSSEIDLPDYVLNDARAAELFLRILFSALVDADYLDTERHFQAGSMALRGTEVTLAELWQRFEHDQQQLSGRRSDAISQVRHQVYQACLAAAERPPGLFRLTVPTGGGKTRSAMAFALRHALRYGQQRVIVAVPFISITEQTADVYRQVFETSTDGRPMVLEHHSMAAGADVDDDDFHPAQVWARLAAENWDAPIIVTTTVQLFESLFANTPSRCRKVHNLARSVIILDEAQTLPSQLLQPILDALQELCSHYGTTVVLSTATQPAFESIPIFASATATEIVPDPARFFQTLRRVNYQWRTDCPLAWHEVAQIMRSQPQALAVLNTKKDALALLDALDDPEAFHLSTLLCGAHRLKVIQKVKRRLGAGEPCRLVSTQVIEAGVDLDFPLVLRALGPLDGIIQAAGRCNREGRLERGQVIVFRPKEERMPQGTYTTAAGVTGALLGRGPLDPDDPELSRTYFQMLFESVDTDREGIQQLRSKLDFPEVARRFRMIDDATESVAVTGYGSEEDRRMVLSILTQLRRGTPQARRLLRRLQPYLVSVRTREAERYRRQGLISPVIDGLGEWIGPYDPIRGLGSGITDPEALVV